MTSDTVGNCNEHISQQEMLDDLEVLEHCQMSQEKKVKELREKLQAVDAGGLFKFDVTHIFGMVPLNNRCL